MAKWTRKSDGSPVLDTNDLQLSKSMRLLDTDMGQRLMGQSYYTVRKVYTGQYKCVDGSRTYHVLGGYAVVDESGKPLVWKNGDGTVIIEIFRLKSAAVWEAEFYNRNGLSGTALAVQEAWTWATFPT